MLFEVCIYYSDEAKDGQKNMWSNLHINIRRSNHTTYKRKQEMYIKSYKNIQHSKERSISTTTHRAYTKTGKRNLVYYGILER